MITWVRFDKSKGLQDLLMSPETYALLVAELNADLEYRDNLRQARSVVMSVPA